MFVIEKSVCRSGDGADGNSLLGAQIFSKSKIVLKIVINIKEGEVKS